MNKMKTLTLGLLLPALLLGASAASAQDTRFRTYGATAVSNYAFPHRKGGNADSCATATSLADKQTHCRADFVTVGQLNDRAVGFGPYGGVKDDGVAKRFFFLRDKAPDRRWDCGFDGWGVVNWTNWLKTSRCLDQAGADKYEELVRNLLGVKKGEEYKGSILSKQLGSDRARLPQLIRNFLDANGNGAEMVFEIGNEPNVYPPMDPGTYGWYYREFVTAIRKAATTVGSERKITVNVKFMPAGFWIFEGLPTYLQDTLDQGLEVSFGRVKILVPTGVKTCLGVPCGVNTKWVDITSGIDIKGRTYTDTFSYWRKFLAVAGRENIDYGNLHFYPYIDTDAEFGKDKMSEHIRFLGALSHEVAAGTRSGQVWLTEMGNINPLGVDATLTRVMQPMMEALKENRIPQITRWYWFKNAGDDKKFKQLPTSKVNGAFLALGWLHVQTWDFLLGPLVTIEKPAISAAVVYKLTTLTNRYIGQTPAQGLYEDVTATKLRSLGVAYHSLALAPPLGQSCNGSPGAWDGCRGSGCSVCMEKVKDFPKYFKNRPGCSANPTCANQFYQCNAACTPPDPLTDR